MKNRFLTLVGETQHQRHVSTGSMLTKRYATAKKQTKRTVEKAIPRYSKIFQYLTHGNPQEVQIPKTRMFSSGIKHVNPMRETNMVNKPPFYQKPSQN